MAMSKATSAEDYKLISGFQAARKTLLDKKYADRLQKPLAYWALPKDRRLPLAFLGRSLKELLDTPFEELSATSGVGQKKMSSLLKLLHRAAADEPPAVPFGISGLAPESSSTGEKSQKKAGAEKFDPSIVSETLWARWCNTVREFDLGHEKLGLLAPTLQSLPTVIWHMPLGEYLDRSAAEIRAMRTHGEKRVRVVLEVFYVVHEILAEAGTQKHLRVCLVPAFVRPIENWITSVLEKPGVPTLDEIRANFTIPLLDQIKIDAGETVHKLVQGRLGIGTSPQSVRAQSEKMGVTRARVYQLLETCAKVMNVRWPDGRRQLALLAEKLQVDRADKDAKKLFDATREFVFPDKYEGSEEK